MLTLICQWGIAVGGLTFFAPELAWLWLGLGVAFWVYFFVWWLTEGGR